MPTEKEYWLREDMDKRENDELLKALGKYGVPEIYNRPEFYKDRKDIKIAIYRENTYISVYEESRKTGISMHAICKRKGLVYESLLW